MSKKLEVLIFNTYCNCKFVNATKQKPQANCATKCHIKWQNRSNSVTITTDGLEAVLSRQRRGSNVLNRGEAEAEAESSRPRRGRLNSRQGQGEAERNRCCLCHFDIMHNAHVEVTCSCFVVNDSYQWKILQRSFITNTIHTVIVL